MKRNIKMLFLCTLFLLFFCLLLLRNEKTLYYARLGLNAWYQNMVPTLFPFMVLSGLMLRTGISEKIAAVFQITLGKLFQLSKNCFYIIMIGFLCGFPMGAVIIAQSISLQKITKREGEYLLSFCNNIGPVFFIGFVLQKCPIGTPKLCFVIMYAIPLCYGLFMRYTLYRDISMIHNQKQQVQNKISFLTAFEEAMQAGIDNITRLGGYMIVFNILNILIPVRLYSLGTVIKELIPCLIEINGGISAVINSKLYPYIYSMLPFGGICCLAQTVCVLQNSGISIRKYVFHKGIQCILTAACYFFVL